MIAINTDLTNPKILTPVGRLVGGDPFTPQTKDNQGNPLLFKKGPNAGQPCVRYYIAVAIPKTDQDYAGLWAKIHNAGRTGMPQLFDAAGTCTSQHFAWKIVDGDDTRPNENNRKPCDQDGYPGNWIVKFGGMFAPSCHTARGATVLTDPASIKRGYFVRVYGSVKANGDTARPGVYLNPDMVELIGYGEEMRSGPDASAAFGGTPAALPAGASATPLAPAAPMAGTAPYGPVGPAPTAGPAPAAPPPAPLPMAPPPPLPVAPPPPPAPVATVRPAPDFVNGPKHILNGTPYTVADLKAAGYGDAQIAALPVA